MCTIKHKDASRLQCHGLGIVAVMIMVGLLLAACAPAAPPAAKEKPSKLEPIEGSEFQRVVLTEKAAQRIGLQTTTVDEKMVLETTAGSSLFSPAAQKENEPAAKTGTDKKTPAAEEKILLQAIPYAAIIYDINGNTWVYVNPEGLTFARQRVVVYQIVGEQAVLAENLPLGTKVVTTGVAELYGAETGVGK